MTSGGSVAAVDLGATSGRVIVGHVDGEGVRLRHVARFPNTPVTVREGDRDAVRWNILELYRNVVEGLQAAAVEAPDVRAVGIDSWAVDYGLLSGGRVVQSPYHYRDGRTASGVAEAHRRMPAEELYARTGLQHLPFNTLFQLTVDRLTGGLEGADTALLVPDLVAYWLTGATVTERTNASTTGLLDPTTGEWAVDVFDRLELPKGLFAPLVDPGTVIGPVLPSIGLPSHTDVTALGSHDTASAVAAVPAENDRFAYISSGTWSLVGVELEAPLISEAGRVANFTNEGGVDGRTRYLKNVSGLWLLSESMRTWELQDGGRSTPSEQSANLHALLAEAAGVTTPVPVFDPADDRFLPPGDMPTRIAAWCRDHDLQVPTSRAEIVRSILESLAEAYAHTLAEAVRLTGKTVDVVHIVGGGAQNELLCQLTADATGRRVIGGPVEATAIGNVLVQARAAGLVSGSLEFLRSLVRRAFPSTEYAPRGDCARLLRSV
jgi:rhamnulokinase